MNSAGLTADDGAVSPVIGVIMMVAITVVLAAVIASFVMGVPAEVEQSKSATFSLDYQESTQEMTLIHEQGEPLDADKVFFQGENLGGNASATWEGVNGGVDSSSRIITGKSVILSSVPPDFELRLVYDAGDSTTTLQEEQGPAA